MLFLFSGSPISYSGFLGCRDAAICRYFVHTCDNYYTTVESFVCLTFGDVVWWLALLFVMAQSEDRNYIVRLDDERWLRYLILNEMMANNRYWALMMTVAVTDCRSWLFSTMDMDMMNISNCRDAYGGPADELND